ncbi:hypothetical protein [Gordonia iterans]
MTDRQRRWLRLTERSLRTSAYWMVGVAGLSSLIWTPVTIRAELGPVMVTIWSAFLIAGGITAAIASTLERWLIEMPAIPLVITGLALYLTALWSITIDGEIGRLAQTATITAYALHLGARWIQLRALAIAVNH